MDQHAFVAQLNADGYTEVETRSLDPRPENHRHDHPYAIRGLVLSGTFIVADDERRVAYGSGQIFDVGKGRVHSEEIGAEGAHIVVARKY